MSPLSTAVATRYLGSVWDVVSRVADELVSAKPDYVEINELVDVDDLRARYATAQGGLA